MTAEPIRVLIVEDQLLLLEVALGYFADRGFAVSTATDASEALAALRSGVRFDVLFTDIRIPGGTDGVDLGKYAATRMPDLRVVYTSGYSDTIPQLSERERYLPKPYSDEGLDHALSGLGVTHPG